MAKGSFSLLTVILVSALAGAQVQASGPADLDIKNAINRSALACTPLNTTIQIPNALVERAKLKARLLNLLRESLFDDAKGVVNIGREKEIRKLANKLRGERTD